MAKRIAVMTGGLEGDEPLANVHGGKELRIDSRHVRSFH